jgi:predicted nucleic acid-binding protein
VTLIDTNILLDILSNDPIWRPWSVDMLEQRSGLGTLVITDVIYAELSPGFRTDKDVDSAMADLGVVLQRIPKPALFLAGRVFERYRRAGGVGSNVLADFFIGAHAQVARLPILTRDRRRYRTYFPDVELIAP